MSKITYRLLEENDLGNYKKLWAECLATFPDNFGTTYQEEIEANFRLAAVIRDSNDNRLVFGAFFDEQKLDGICGFTTELRWKASHRGELRQMYVSPEYSEKGIGRQLANLTTERVFNHPQIELITLGVMAANIRAIRLYESVGFKEYGRLDRCFKTAKSYSTQCFMFLNKN